MGNKKRGEVGFFLGAGEDRRDYTLRFSLNTLCILEQNLGRSFMSVYQSWTEGDIGMLDLRETVRASIIGGQKMTPDEVGDLIEEYGIEKMLEKLMDCLENSALIKAAQEETAGEDPTKPGTSGAGTTSSTTQSPPE